MVRWKFSVFSVFLTTVLALSPFSAFAQSEEKIQEAIRIFNQGKRLHQERRYEEAINEYRRAVKLDRENPFLFNSMGLAFAAVGNFKEALKAFEKTLQLNPLFTDAYNNMGMVYAEMGQREKAFDAFTRAIRNPDYLTVEKPIYNLGNLYLEDRNFELAIMYFKRAIEKKPEFALGHRGLGKTYLAMDDEEGALREFQRALDLSPDDIESLFQLARIYQSRGESQEAREMYRRVVEVDRFSPFGRVALQRLDALKNES